MAVSAVALVGSVLVTSPIAASASSDLTCMGLTPEQAADAGYRVQIGGPGTDVLVGGNVTKDYILGLGGSDVLSGAGAGDIICGGDGNDIISGGDGNDWVDGGAGNDNLDLGAGADVAHGGRGNDRMVGGPGNDRLFGSDGADRMSGETGADAIHGQAGSDVIFGGSGNDRINAGAGPDRISGGPGRDTLRGARGNDLISGDSGRDLLIGGGGNDILDGDADRDRLRGGPGNDRCDPAGPDKLVSCERDLGGIGLLSTPNKVVDQTPDDHPHEPDPVSMAQDRPANPAPPSGQAVPADQAPQGTNRFGWPLLTDVGLGALLTCESGVNHSINTGNGFYGAAQWLPTTWNAAALGAGFEQYVGVLPNLVPADVQDVVTKWWWAATRPNTQWPTCQVLAMSAMNVLAP